MESNIEKGSGDPRSEKLAEIQTAKDLLTVAQEANFPENNEEELRNTVEALETELEELV